MTEQTSSDWLGLSGRVCVVTGGGGGIGRATAVSLARAGARVAAVDLDEHGLEVTRAALLEISAGHIVARCDTSSAESVAAASERIEKSLGSRRTAMVPSRRIGMPQDMADAILFLASDRSSYVNGDEITVDGGYANMLMNLVPRPGFD
jgi:NAD(P)-dependent dehydrogenase (short-subunit alcohol dehydrogenase family)